MRSAWILIALATACHKDAVAPTSGTGGTPGVPASTADVDALWKLAPSGALFGVVASPRALQLSEHAWADVTKFLDTMPELAPQMKQLRGKLTAALGAPDLSFAAAGMTNQHGGAFFMLPGKKGLLILPVADRDTFLKIAHGTKGDPSDKVSDMTCKTTHGVYACSDDPAVLDHLGTGSMTAAAAHARGDIELAGTNLPAGHEPVSFGAVIQLARGQITLRGSVTGVPAKALAMMGPASKPVLDGSRTTGFAVGHIKALLDTVPMPPQAQVILKTLGDPITMVTRAATMDLQVPLTDAAPIQTGLIDHCADGPLGKIGAAVVDGVCQFTVPNMPAITTQVWIDGKTLHFGHKPLATDTASELPDFGKELAGAPWQFAFYGHGSLLGIDGAMAAQLEQSAATAGEPGMLRVMIRALSLLNEVGTGVRIDGQTLSFVFGVRTAWANPDDVVAKLIALNPDDIAAGKGAELAKPIVAAAKGSPLANDVAAGFTGLMIPTATIGVLAGVAVPAFLQYMKRSKASEASLNLNRIGKSLKMFYGENAKLPVGDAPLTPAKHCCGQPANKCAPDVAAWHTDKIWSALDMEIDEPTIYQYRYHSDGKTATVEAVGDADCDGNPATFVLTVTSDGGQIHEILIPPPSGVY